MNNKELAMIGGVFYREFAKLNGFAGVIELRRTLNHYFSEICTS